MDLSVLSSSVPTTAVLKKIKSLALGGLVALTVCAGSMQAATLLSTSASGRSDKLRPSQKKYFVTFQYKDADRHGEYNSLQSLAQIQQNSPQPIRTERIGFPHPTVPR